jgi:hypothetical protein
MTARAPGDHDWMPAPPEIEHAPEIAVLAVLRRTLDLAVYALLASHPCLSDLEPSYHLQHPEVRAADLVLARAHRLRDALDHYRAAIAALYARTAAKTPPASDPGDSGGADDIPF